MNTARIYKDIDGNDRSIHYMVKYEPQWAANRVQVGEDALNSLQQLKAEIAAIVDDFSGPLTGDDAQDVLSRLRQLSAV